MLRQPCNRAIRLALLPARVAYGLADEAVWLGRAACEIYGIRIGGPVLPSQDEIDWLAQNAGFSLDNEPDDL